MSDAKRSGVGTSDDAVPAGDFEREPLPYQAGFVGSKAFLAYRQRGDQRRSRSRTFARIIDGRLDRAAASRPVAPRRVGSGHHAE
jgi:hypothetical protein